MTGLKPPPIGGQLSQLLEEYEHLTVSVDDAQARLEREIEDADQWQPEAYDLGAVAFVIGNVYLGAERLFVRIAKEIDDHMPEGDAWHRELLTQMTEPWPGRRPAVLTEETATRLDKYFGVPPRSAQCVCIPSAVATDGAASPGGSRHHRCGGRGREALRCSDRRVVERRHAKLISDLAQPHAHVIERRAELDRA